MCNCLFCGQEMEAEENQENPHICPPDENISFQPSVTVEREAHMPCPHCNGKKMEVPDCEECKGRGWISDPGGGTMTCPECDGESCSVCGGDGYVAAPPILI